MIQHMMKALIATSFVISSIAASAHGDEDQSKKAGPVRKEQKEWGIAGAAKAAKRSVQIKMLDTMRFSPELINVKQGETLKIVLQNTGQMQHEFVIGTKKELEEHAALMVKFPNMQHDEPYMAHVGPGRSDEIIWTFNRAGEFDFACLIAGHYQSGMLGKINVAAKKLTKKVKVMAYANY
jgi:uncharacterized cupredoxin-like copper-binding protein